MTTEMGIEPLVERVARAICERGAVPNSWESRSEHQRECSRKDARAAIAAFEATRTPEAAYKFIGNRAASDGHVVGLQCDHCRVSWGGCAAESCCPICGAEKGYHADDMGLCYCATCRPFVVAEVDPTRKALERILSLRRQILIDIGASHAGRINVADDATIQRDADFRAELEGAFAEAASAIMSLPEPPALAQVRHPSGRAHPLEGDSAHA